MIPSLPEIVRWLLIFAGLFILARIFLSWVGDQLFGKRPRAKKKKLRKATYSQYIWVNAAILATIITFVFRELAARFVYLPPDIELAVTNVHMRPAKNNKPQNIEAIASLKNVGEDVLYFEIRGYLLVVGDRVVRGLDGFRKLGSIRLAPTVIRHLHHESIAINNSESKEPVQLNFTVAYGSEKRVPTRELTALYVCQAGRALKQRVGCSLIRENVRPIDK